MSEESTGSRWARALRAVRKVLNRALAHFGTSEIFNTDQGSQFTSPRFTGVLLEAGVRISMDLDGRLHRAKVAIPEIPMRVYQRLRDRIGTAWWTG